jgi:hypothetical protein
LLQILKMIDINIQVATPMHSSRISLAAAALLALALPQAHAQLPVPRLNSIFPCGARQGTTVDCAISGGELQGASGLFFSHPGLTAQLVKANTFKVAVAADVPPAQYDVRVITPLGVSNFRAFVVGDWPESVEKEPNNEPAQAQRVSVPVVVNGRMDGATDVDHYVFAAKKGERLFINCWAWRIDSQLDGTLRLFDPAGKEIAYSGDYYGKDPFIDFTAPADGDYVLKVWDFVYGGGGDYFYRLHIGSQPYLDAIVPAAVRPGAKATVTVYGRNLPGGKPAPDGAQVQGRPLEVITRTIEVPAASALSLHSGEAMRPGRTSLDGMAYRLSTPAGSSNPLFLGFTADPLLVEKEPNNDRPSAQRLPIPCDLTGTLAPAGDVDFYAFTAKRSEKIVIEMIGERQSGLMDPFLTGFDLKGKKLISVDDSGRNIGQLRFATQNRDPRWDFTAPADGEYFVQVRDLYYQQRGDARFTYRLSVRRPEPDFRLVVVPASETQPDCTVVGRGGNQSMDVLAFRHDGFDEPIRIEASALPAGVTCEPVVIGPGKTSVPLVFHAAKDAPIGQAALQVTGMARLGDKEMVRVARGGGLAWPTVNTPGLARLSDSIVLAVRAANPFTVTAAATRLTIAAGEKLPIAVQIARASNWTESVQLSGHDLPQGATVALVTVPSGAGTGQVELSLPSKVRAGTYSFTLLGAGQVPRDYAGERGTSRGNAQRLRVVYPSNPITINVTAAAPKAK